MRACVHVLSGSRGGETGSAAGLQSSWVSRDRGLTVTHTPSAGTIEHY